MKNNSDKIHYYRKWILLCLFVAAFGLLLTVESASWVGIFTTVPCTVVNYDDVMVSTGGGYSHARQKVTVQYFGHQATADLDGNSGISNPREYYAIGTLLGCKVNHRSPSPISEVGWQHYSNATREMPNFTMVDGSITPFVIAVVAGSLIAIFALSASAVMQEECLNIRRRDPKAFRAGRTRFVLCLLAIALVFLLYGNIMIMVNIKASSFDPCMVTDYKEINYHSATDGPWSRLEDAPGDRVRINVEVKVAESLAKTGSTRVKIYEGPYDNVTSIRQYYGVGQTLGCWVHETRWFVIGKVSIGHYGEGVMEGAVPRKPIRGDANQIMLPVMLCLYMIPLTLFITLFKHYLRAPAPAPVDPPVTDPPTYEKPVEINN